MNSLMVVPATLAAEATRQCNSEDMRSTNLPLYGLAGFRSSGARYKRIPKRPRVNMKSARLNIFGMIDRDSMCYGFTSRQSIKADNVAEFIDSFSLAITKPTFIVLDNASVYTGGRMKQMIEEWRERGLYIFFLPPYSPHLNIAETLWRVLKTKWIKPTFYIDDIMLFDAVHNTLNGIVDEYRVNFSKVA